MFMCLAARIVKLYNFEELLGVNIPKLEFIDINWL